MASNRFALAEAELLAAFRRPGCPVCRIKADTARRYIAHLLWENVNDLGTRTHLAHSLGFCPEHTWQLFHMAKEGLGSELGPTIIYDDLVRRVITGLHEFAARIPAAGRRRSRRASWCEALGAASKPAASRPEGVWPSEPCRPCEFARKSELSNLGWLVEACAEDHFRARYAASDGLCLNHLRQALELSGASDPSAAGFLIERAVQRLSVLATDLDEYQRKQNWHYHEEATTPDERDPPDGRRSSSAVPSCLLRRKKRTRQSRTRPDLSCDGSESLRFAPRVPTGPALAGLAPLRVR